MAASVSRMDGLVKEYLLYRGFHSTLKIMENESKTEKEKGYRVDKIMDQLNFYISSFDLAGLRDYWAFLDQRLFSHLEQLYVSSVRKLEISVLKLYLVNAIQTNKQDKVTEFFEKMTFELQSQPEWKEWFVLPFVKNPEDNNVFSMYFTKQWQDTLFLSLHNFLSVVIQNMPVPNIMSYEEDRRRIARLQEENRKCREQVKALLEKRASAISMQGSSEPQSPSDMIPGASSMGLMDDFYVISQETTIHDKPEQPAKTIKSFIKNIGLPSSPITSKKNISPPVGGGTSTGASNSGPAPKKTFAGQPVNVAKDESGRKTGKESAAGAAAGGGVVAAAKPRRPVSGALTSQISTGAGVQQMLPSGGRPEQAVKMSSDGGAKKEQVKSPTGANTKSKEKSGIPICFSSSNKKPGPQRKVEAGASSTPRDAGASQSFKDGATSQDSATPFLLLSQDEYKEHHSSVTHCSFSSSGHVVASSDVDGVVKVWSLQPSPVTMATLMSKSMLLSLEWVHKMDRWLLLGSKTGSVRLFDSKEKKMIRETTSDSTYPRIVSLSCSPLGNSFVCSAAGRARPPSGSLEQTPRTGKLSLWDLKSFKMERYLPTHPGPVAVNCTVFNHNAQLLVTGAADGIIRLYDMQKHESIANWQAHSGEVYSVNFSTDENSCYSMGSDGKFIKWSIHKTGQKLMDLPIHSGACGPFILTGAAGYRQVQTPKGRLFAFDSEGNNVLTCGQNGGIIYQLNQSTGLGQALPLGGHKTPVVCVDWSTAIDCKMCLTGSMDGKVQVSTLLTK